MTLVNVLLAHRATISRGTTSVVNGNQKTTYSDIATDVHCFVARSGWETSYLDQTNSQSKAAGSIYVAPTTDLRSGDLVKLSNGPLGTYQVLSGGGAQFSWDGFTSHLEYPVKQVG